VPVPHRRAFLERLEGSDRRVVSKHLLNHERERQLIGWDSTADVKLQHRALARKHAWLEFGPLGRWWLADSGTMNGTWVNRTHYSGHRRLLDPGDIIRIDGRGESDIVFRYGVEGWVPKDEAMRAMIDQAPGETARWEVWADFLEEQGDPLAQRIRGIGPSPGDVGLSSGHVWAHGFVSRGVLRRGSRLLANLQTELEVLLGNPFSRWMQALEVDIASYNPDDEAAEALQVLEILERERPGALCVLTFQLTHRPKGRRLEDQFARLKQALPKLQSDHSALLPF
jgi:hypothetical protein